jgi:threonine synthase
VHAIRATGGGAVVVDEQSVVRDQARLARHGCYAELSSAASLTGLERLIADGKLARSDTAVLIATSNGYKDFPAAGLPA